MLCSRRLKRTRISLRSRRTRGRPSCGGGVWWASPRPSQGRRSPTSPQSSPRSTPRGPTWTSPAEMGYALRHLLQSLSDTIFEGLKVLVWLVHLLATQYLGYSHRFSQCSTTGVTNAMVYVILSVGVLHIKEPLLVIRTSTPSDSSGFPLSLSE